MAGDLPAYKYLGRGKHTGTAEGCKRNKVVFEKISDEMEKGGFKRSGVQFRDKIKKIRGDYKKVKDKRGRTGEGV